MSTKANAAAIWNGGACNPRALARELVKAIDEACANGSDGAASEEAAPARVILAQLTSLMRVRLDGIGGAESPHGDIFADLRRCEEV